MHAKTDETTTVAFPVPWAIRLLGRLHAMYGSKFLQLWEGIERCDLAKTWAEELTGFTGEEIAVGLAACRSRPWPPTLPEFIGLCRPWTDPETAFREAVLGMSERNGGAMGTWSHPAIFWAAVRIGAHDLLNSGWQAMRGRWEAALRDVLGQGSWKPIPEPATALPAPGEAMPSREDVREFARQAKPAAKVRDHKAWARKILDAPQGRSPTVLDMARRGLA